MLDSEPVVDPDDPVDELVSTNPVEEEVVSVSECSPVELEVEPDGSRGRDDVLSSRRVRGQGLCASEHEQDHGVGNLPGSPLH